MDNNPGGLGGLGGMPLSADDRKLFMDLLAQWYAKQNDPTFSDQDFSSFFEKNKTGGARRHARRRGQAHTGWLRECPEAYDGQADHLALWLPRGVRRASPVAGDGGIDPLL